MQKVTTVRFDEATLTKLDNLAEDMSRPRAWVIKDAVSRYLEAYERYCAEVQKGIDDVDAGRVFSQDEVKEELRGLGIDVG